MQSTVLVVDAVRRDILFPHVNVTRVQLCLCSVRFGYGFPRIAQLVGACFVAPGWPSRGAYLYECRQYSVALPW